MRVINSFPEILRVLAFAKILEIQFPGYSPDSPIGFLSTGQSLHICQTQKLLNCFLANFANASTSANLTSFCKNAKLHNKKNYK